MTQYERKELEEKLNKKVEQAWDNWCDALAQLRSSFDFARRAAGYDMEAEAPPHPDIASCGSSA